MLLRNIRNAIFSVPQKLNINLIKCNWNVVTFSKNKNDNVWLQKKSVEKALKHYF